MKYEINVEGLPELKAAFEKVQDGVADLRKNGIWLKVKQAAYRELKEQFSSEGAAGVGGKWKELSSPYKERKAKKYGSVPILQATGKLYRSLTRDGGDSVVDYQPLEMSLGTTVPYAAYHQRGTGKMPARPVFDFTDESKKRILEPIQDGLQQLIANARLKSSRGF